MSASEESERDDTCENKSGTRWTQPARIDSAIDALPALWAATGEDSGYAEILTSVMEHGLGSDENITSDHDSDLPGDERLVTENQLEPHIDVEMTSVDGSSAAVEETYFARPNRYRGPASTWRSWNQNDRSVVEYLDHERAQNLSIHLYNARLLKICAQKPTYSLSRQAPGAASAAVENLDNFKPPKVWSAWPLPPEAVPRSRRSLFHHDPRPSGELEESLINVTMKVARSRWSAREWEKVEDSERVTPEYPSPIKREDETSRRDHSSTISDGLSTLANYDSLDPGMPVLPLFSSRAFDDPASSPSTAISDDDSLDLLYSFDFAAKPVPIADEEKVGKLLTPAIRQVIGKLDSLLMGLHYARKAYATPTSKDNELMSELSGDTGGRAESNSDFSISAADGETSGGSVVSKKLSKSKASKRKHRRQKFDRFGLRDWSDIMGLAVLAGWDPATVKRASKRCSELFGEDMIFRTFRPGGQDGQKSHFFDHFASGKSSEPKSVAA